MKSLYHSLLLLIAGSTQKELASQIRYLKIENEVLRFKLAKRIAKYRGLRGADPSFGVSRAGADEQVHLPLLECHPNAVAPMNLSCQREPVRYP
jgi:hypothetical protein